VLLKTLYAVQSVLQYKLSGILEETAETWEIQVMFNYYSH